MNAARRIWNVAVREMGRMVHTPIYWFCMLIFPIIVVIFFTSLMAQGVPTDMPVAVVDQDNTATTRAIIRRLDGMQTTQVKYKFTNVNEARRAIQMNKCYAFLYFPKGTTRRLMNGEQPTVSFYYSNVYLAPGSMLFRDMKASLLLASAAVGKAKLDAIGKSNGEIKAFLQPVAIDLHQIGNPWTNYNIYLTSVMCPGVLMVLLFLIAPYSIGTELKFKTSHEWLDTAGGNIAIAIIGKMLPQFLMGLIVMCGFELYAYGHLGFPVNGGVLPLLLLAFLSVLSTQCFGIFAFGLMPSLRMSMSVCSLWSVVSFSVCGATYPLQAMSPMIQSLGQLFPLRHYYMIYQIGVLNGFPFSYYAIYVAALVAFMLLPFLTAKNLKKAMLEFVYIP